VAAVAIDAAQFKGVLPLPLSSLRVTFPVFKNPANAHKAVSLTAAHDVVGGDPDRFGQPPRHLSTEADRDGGAAGQRLQRRTQPAIGEGGGMQAAGDLPELLEHAVHLRDRALQPLRHLLGPGQRWVEATRSTPQSRLWTWIGTPTTEWAPQERATSPGLPEAAW
jgi:hypothetical protein